MLPRKLDDLDAHAHLLDGTDGRSEVAVARHDDRDVEVPGGLHHVDDELDVEVRLDLAVAVLPDVLAHDLVAAPAEEVVEVPLVLVVRVEARVRVCANEVATRAPRLQQRDVVDVHTGRLGRVEDVRNVNEDGDVLAHPVSYLSRRWRRTAARVGFISAPAPCGIHGAPEDRLSVDESLALPARVFRRIVRLRRLDRRTSLVGRRSEALLDEAVAHGFRFARRVDDEQVDGSDVATCANRRSDREDGAPHEVATPLGDEHGRVGEEDQLAQEVSGAKRAGRAVTQAIAAECDECLDVGDPGRSDPVLHALRCSLVVGGAKSIKVVATGADQTAGFACRTGATHVMRQ